jgi:hypothetical protein
MQESTPEPDSTGGENQIKNKIKNKTQICCFKSDWFWIRQGRLHFNFPQLQIGGSWNSWC